MKPWRLIVILMLLSLLAVAAHLWWKHGETRRLSVSVLIAFDQALQTSDTAGLLSLVSIPATINRRTATEQVEFLTKALRDEISPEGLAVLKRDGEFGPLEKVFPDEARSWVSQAGVRPEDCVAFRMERNGIRAEAVLARQSTPGNLDPAFRIVRCNNVKQLAAAEPRPQ